MANSYSTIRPGIGSVGQYQMSGLPWLTGSSLDTNLGNNGEVHFSFPRIAKSFTVINRSSVSLMITFDSRANSSDIESYRHFITLPNSGDSITIDCRTKEFYVSVSGSSGTGSCEVLAEITGVERNGMPKLSGSGINSAGHGFLL